MTEETPLRSLGHTVDWRLVILYLLIMLFGWMNIYAAVQSMEPSGIFDLRYNCGKQALWIGGALLLAVLILFIIKPYFWESVCRPAYGVVLMLLVQGPQCENL